MDNNIWDMGIFHTTMEIWYVLLSDVSINNRYSMIE